MKIPLGALLISIAIMIPAGIANGLSTPTTSRVVDLAPAYEQGFRWDFSAWDQDLDRDRLDDRIEAVATHGLDALPRHADGFLPFFAQNGPGGPVVDLYIAYDVGFGPSDAEALEQLGIHDIIEDPMRPGAWVRGATALQAELVSGLDGVVMVELAQKFRALNREARWASRVDDTATYSHGVHEDLGYTGDGVGVAILDTGVDDAHPYLAGRFVAGADAIPTCGLLSQALEINPDDDQAVGLIGVLIYHGTHVAGTALGNAATVIQSGMATSADLYDVKVLSAAGASCLGSVSAGLSWVHNFNTGATLWKSGLAGTPYDVDPAKRISVVSMSLGGACSNGSDSLSQWVDWLVVRGVTVVVAVGNDGSLGCITSPSAAPLAISVGAYDDHNTATRSDDEVDGSADFTNCGPSIPSPSASQLNQRKPDVTASGVAVTSAAGNPVPQGPAVPLVSWTRTLSGTSMATPVVSGIAALMYEANPDLSPADVKQILRESADARSADDRTDPTTRGSQDTTYPKYHTCWGWGQVDAYGAVRRAEDLRSGTLTSPNGTVAANQKEVAFNLTMATTKTELMNHGPDAINSDGDEVTIQLVLDGWSDVTIEATSWSVSSGPTGSLSVSTSTTTTTTAGVTTAEAEFTVTGSPDASSTTTDLEDTEILLELDVTATAPASGPFEASGHFNINGMDGKATTISW